MDFELDEDQQLLRDSAREIIAKECSPAFVRSVVDDGVDPTSWWNTIVSLDWPGVAVPEAVGGLGFGTVELMLLVEELGRAIDPSPFIATTTQFASLIAAAGSADDHKRWLGPVASGSLVGAAAYGGFARGDRVTATAAESGWVLDGVVRHVVDGGRSDEVAVVADGPNGPQVLVVEGAAITERAIEVSFDPTVEVATLRFEGVAVDGDRALANATSDTVRIGREIATIGWSAATVGAAQRILDLVIAHVIERHQFGVPIGSFQAVKHKIVDVYVALERARALVQFAALTADEDDPRRHLAASMAKAAAGDSQRLAFQHGFQLFGGMGFTWENDLNFALRRAKIGSALFGSTTSHRRAVAQEVLAR